MNPWEEYQTEDKNKSDSSQFIEPSKPWEEYQLKEVDTSANSLLDYAKKAAISGGEAAIEGLSQAGQFMERYGDAPARAAVGAMIGRENPFVAVKSQFGEDPKQAPSGADIARALGVSGAEEGFGSFSNRDVLRYLTRLTLGGVAQEALVPKQNIEKMAASKPPGWLDERYSPQDYVGLGAELLLSPFNLIGTGAISGTMRRLGQAGKKGMDYVPTFKKAADITEQAPVLSGELVQKTPSSFEEMMKWTPSEDYSPIKFERLQQIKEKLPSLKHPPLPYHEELVRSPEKMQELKSQYEFLPSEFKTKISQYNDSIIQETASEIQKKIKGLNKGKNPLNLSQAGEEFIDWFKNIYEGRRKTLQKQFTKLDAATKDLPIARPGQLIWEIATNPDSSFDIMSMINRRLDNGQMVLEIKPWTTKTGISKTNHDLLAQVIEDLGDAVTFDDVRKIRKTLKENLSTTDFNKTKSLYDLRKDLLNALQKTSETMGQDTRELFKNWAQNQEFLDDMEYIAGGSINKYASLKDKPNAVKVIDRLFSNKNFVEKVKDLDPEFLESMLATKVDAGLTTAFQDARNYNPSRIKNWAEKNRLMIDLVNPEFVDDIGLLADYGYLAKEFLQSVNPSGSGFVLNNRAQSFTEALTDFVRKGPLQEMKDRSLKGFMERGKKKKAIRFVKELGGESSEGPGVLKRTAGKAAQIGAGTVDAVDSGAGFLGQLSSRLVNYDEQLQERQKRRAKNREKLEEMMKKRRGN